MISSLCLIIFNLLSLRLQSSPLAPSVLVSSEDVHRAWHGNCHCLLGVAPRRTQWGGSACMYFLTFHTIVKNLSH